MQNELLGAELSIRECVDEASELAGIRSIFPCLLKRAAQFIRIAPLLNDVIACELDNTSCYGDLSNKPGLRNLLIQAGRLKSFVDLSLLPFGGQISGEPESLLNSTDADLTVVEQFSAVVVNALSDSGDEGAAISSLELVELLAVPLDVPGEADNRDFAERWNRSLTYWGNGIFSVDDLPDGNSEDFFDLSAATSLMNVFIADLVAVKREGFRGFHDAWLSAVEGKQFEEARELAGVCAKVRVKIVQELTLTRTGFEARLDISNDGSVPLEELAVSIRVNPFNNLTYDATDLFVFDDPVLRGVTDVDGTGIVAAESDARVTWLILPLTEAAPEFDTLYEVSGILSYFIDGVEYIQNLAPDTITVRPDPQLYLKYFYSRDVYADNPFTPEVVEPSVPYFLGILIENRGYGDARNLQIASSQPEIIENEKGLLVDFSIIGARLGNAPTSQSLNIDFGTVEARSNVIGIWEMVSTLRGKFFNFSATYRYEGPIDDARLSLIEGPIETYELNHLVRVTGDHPAMTSRLGYIDDGYDDFLVNDNPDAFYLPNTVFTSDTRASNYSVSSVVDRGVAEDPVVNTDGTVSVLVYFNVTPEERSLHHDWVYARADDPMASTGLILQSATRVDVDYTLIPEYNSWQTSWIDYLVGDVTDEQNYIHLFDYGLAPVYRLLYALQQPVTDLRVTESTNSSLTLSWVEAAGATASYVLIKPEGLGDEYYKSVLQFTQINTCTINNLAAGRRYVVKVYTGSKGNYETTGASVAAATLGVSSCGDSIIDLGEECDDGPGNSTPESNCTAFCTESISFNQILGPPRSDVPTSEAPTSGFPTSDIPTSDLPSSDAPTSSSPTSDSPTSDIPTSDLPSSDAPTSGSPTSDSPTSDIPSSEEPSSSIPTSASPTSGCPSSEEPSSSMPTSAVPTSDLPSSYLPPSALPTSIVPTSRIPTSSTPTSNIPMSDTPSSPTPTSSTPTSDIPTSDQPTSNTPRSNAPTSDAPMSDSPTSSTPTTETPTTPAPTLSPVTIQRKVQAGQTTFAFFSAPAPLSLVQKSGPFELSRKGNKWKVLFTGSRQVQRTYSITYQDSAGRLYIVSAQVVPKMKPIVRRKSIRRGQKTAFFMPRIGTIVLQKKGSFKRFNASGKRLRVQFNGSRRIGQHKIVYQARNGKNYVFVVVVRK